METDEVAIESDVFIGEWKKIKNKHTATNSQCNKTETKRISLFISGVEFTVEPRESGLEMYVIEIREHSRVMSTFRQTRRHHKFRKV